MTLNSKPSTLTYMPMRVPSQANYACYLTEESLVKDLECVVTDTRVPFRCRAVTTEFDYTSGRTDLLGMDRNHDVHAFEAKLTKWRKALEQAGRNTCFAHYTYVVLPARAAGPALRAEAEFLKRGVGLVLMGGETPRLRIKPRRCEPLLPWLTRSAQNRIGTAQ